VFFSQFLFCFVCLVFLFFLYDDVFRFGTRNKRLLLRRRRRRRRRRKEEEEEEEEEIRVKKVIRGE